jgi:putative transposase
LVDTQGLVLEVRVHSAEVQDLKRASSSCWMSPRASVCPSVSGTCGWMPLYTGEDKGAGWVRKVLGWTAEIVRHSPKPAPEEVMRAWVREFNKEGVPMDLERFMPPKGPRPFLPKRWIVERTFSWLSQNRRLSKDHERLPESSEAFICVAMSRLMARRLARS